MVASHPGGESAWRELGSGPGCQGLTPPPLLTRLVTFALASQLTSESSVKWGRWPWHLEHSGSWCCPCGAFLYLYLL